MPRLALKLSLDRAFPFLAQLITQLGCENCPAMHVITGNQGSEDSHTPSRVHLVQIEVEIDALQRKLKETVVRK